MTLSGGQADGENVTGEEKPEVTLTPAPENAGGATPSPDAKAVDETTTVPDAGTTPAVDPAAAAAPMTDKTSQEKPSDTPEKPAADKPAAEKPAAAKAERPPRPAKEAEPKGPPRNPPPAGAIHDIVASAAGVTPSAAYMVPDVAGESVAIEIARDDVPAVLTACRNDERLDLSYLRCLSGVDWQEEGLEVVYHLHSFSKLHHLTVKTRVTYEDANVPSAAAIYPAANWHEREARDMFGINFTDHPDLRPLLLPDDMLDHFPLRKENPLQEIEEWQGENLAEGAGEDE